MFTHNTLKYSVRNVTHSTFEAVLVFVEVASSVFVVDDVDEVVVDAASSEFVSFFALLFTITTINFFSSKLYDEMVLSSANIIPKIQINAK